MNYFLGHIPKPRGVLQGIIDTAKSSAAPFTHLAATVSDSLNDAATVMMELGSATGATTSTSSSTAPGIHRKAAPHTSDSANSSDHARLNVNTSSSDKLKRRSTIAGSKASLELDPQMNLELSRSTRCRGRLQDRTSALLTKKRSFSEEIVGGGRGDARRSAVADVAEVSPPTSQPLLVVGVSAPVVEVEVLDTSNPSASLSRRSSVGSIASTVDPSRDAKDFLAADLENADNQLSVVSAPGTMPANLMDIFGQLNFELWEGVLENLDACYFSPTFDPISYWLESCPLESNIDQWIKDSVQKQDNSLSAVISSFAEKIMDRYGDFVLCMEFLNTIIFTLTSTHQLAVRAIASLALFRENFIDPSLRALWLLNKKVNLQKLLDIVARLKVLTLAPEEMQETLQLSQYSDAVLAALEFEQLGREMDTVTVVQLLLNRTTPFLESIEEKLQGVIYDLCLEFDDTSYEDALNAYCHLQKSEVITECVLRYFLCCVDEGLRDLIKLFQGNTTNRTEVNSKPKKNAKSKKKQFIEMCDNFKTEGDFFSALARLMEVAAQLMHHYTEFLAWHANRDDTRREDWRNVRGDLEFGRMRVWRAIQKRIKWFLGSRDLKTLHPSSFINIVLLVNLMIRTGETFVDEPNTSKIIGEPFLESITEFWHAYHVESMQKLRNVFAQENWDPVYTSSRFSLLEIPQLDFSKAIHSFSIFSIPVSLSPKESTSAPSPPAETVFDASHLPDEMPLPKLPSQSQDMASSESDDFLATPPITDTECSQNAPPLTKYFATYGNPFAGSDFEQLLWCRSNFTASTEFSRCNSQEADSIADSADEENWIPGVTTFISPLGLLISRQIGNYVNFLYVLPTCRMSIFLGLCQLIEFSVFCIFYIFSHGTTATNLVFSKDDKSMPVELKNSLMHMRMSFLTGGANALERGGAPGIFQPPQFNPSENFSHPSTLYGLQCRALAVETLISIQEVMRKVRSVIEAWVHPSQRSNVSYLYTNIVDFLGNLRTFMYRCLSRRLVNVDVIHQEILMLNFDDVEVGVEPNGYIGYALNELRTVMGRVKSTELPQGIKLIVWDAIVRKVMAILVESYSCIRKCSPQGRAIMQLDFQFFQTELEKFCELDIINYVNHVDSFIKAYYLTGKDAENWLRTHREFSSKQLLGLVSQGMGLIQTPGARIRLLQIAEEPNSVPK